MTEGDRGLCTAVPSDAECESAKFKILWTLEKWHRADDHAVGLPADEVIYAPKNLLVTGGINLMLNLLCGTTFNTGLSGFTAYASGSAVLRVGNSSTSAASGDTNLGAGGGSQGTTWDESGMNSGFPTVVVTTATWQASFGPTQGNFQWNEVAVQNLPTGSTGPNNYIRLLNHKVQNFGTKSVGSTWTLTFSMTLS